MDSHRQTVNAAIIRPMVDRFPAPVHLGKAPDKDTALKSQIDRYNEKRQALFEDYYSDLKGFPEGVLREAFDATRRRAEEHQINKNPNFKPCWPSSVMFRQEAMRIKKERDDLSSNGKGSSFVCGDKTYLPTSFTKRKWDMWQDWQKHHWRELSFAGQMALKDYFFREYLDYYRKKIKSHLVQ